MLCCMKLVKNRVLFFKKCVLFLVLFVNITNGGRPRSPVVIVNGDGGSQLEVKLDKPSTVHVWCDKNCDWSTIWVSIEDLTPALIDCFTDNMRLVFDNVSKTFSNAPGVQIRVPYFGTTTGIEYLDPYTSHVAEYFGSFVQALVDTGYVRGKSIRAAPYDFRSAPDTTGEYYTKLEKLIEETYDTNQKTPVVLVCHSLGCPYTSMFLHNQPQEWKDKFLRAWLTISAPWGGSIKIIRLYASGYALGVPAILVNPLRFRAFQRSTKSSAYLLPSRKFWSENHVFVQTATRNYTVNDYDVFFKDIGFPEGIAIQKVVPPVFNETAPNVPVLCLHGAGMPTPMTYTYGKGTFPDGPPVPIFGDGDGTVTDVSLKGCSRWQGQQKQPIVIKEFNPAEHNGILQDKDLINFVKDFLDNGNF